MRRYRVLVYEGEEIWIAPNKNEFVKPSEPYRCGKGSIHSMELIPSAKLRADDLFLGGMRLIELMADEVIEAEMREQESGAE